MIVILGVFPCFETQCEEQPPSLNLKIEQVTSGSKHHFFAYIGQCQTIPWNASGRYILCLEIGRIDRMPKPNEAATVCVIDTQKQNQIIALDKTYGWNPQQGTMFYWHPKHAETQFFFNDRDPRTGNVFTVLYDLKTKKRLRGGEGGARQGARSCKSVAATAREKEPKDQGAKGQGGESAKAQTKTPRKKGFEEVRQRQRPETKTKAETQTETETQAETQTGDRHRDRDRHRKRDRDPA